MEESWKSRLSSEFQKPYFRQLTDFVRQEYSTVQCFPPARLIFNAFDQTPFNDVKVVILGQDPYHGDGQAHGLCFSVQDGIPFPGYLIIWAVIYCVIRSRAAKLNALLQQRQAGEY